MTRRNFLTAAPAVAAVTVAATSTAPEDDGPLSPERLDRVEREFRAYMNNPHRDAANASKGTADLRILAGLLRVVERLADDLVDEHDEKCGCPLCLYNAELGHIWPFDDLPHISWTANVLANQVEGEIVRPLRLDKVSAPVALRHLAKLANR